MSPGGLRAMRSWKPFSLTAFHLLRRLRVESPEFMTIIDGGANIGQFARAALMTYPSANLIAFEPLLEEAQTLRKNLADTPRATVLQSALGPENGHLQFHRNSYSLSSSALPLHQNHQDAFPDAVEEGTVEVPVGRLDDLLDDFELPRPALLKLDLQGFEIPALRGATKILTEIDCILVETAFKPLYQGEALFPELNAFLEAAGFRFSRPLDVLEDPNGSIVQMDALFVRVEPGNVGL